MIVQNDADRSRLLEMTDKRGIDSLPVIEDWQAWWQEWGPRIAAEEGRQPWIIFMLDAHEKTLEGLMLLSRLIRNKPKWNTTGWTQAEWGNVALFGAEARCWFEQNHPRLEDVPEYAQFIISAQYGVFCALERLTREMRAIQDQGYKVVALESGEDGVTMRETA